MTNENTMELLRKLRLHAMVRAWKEQEALGTFDHLSFGERLGLLVDAQWIERSNGRYQRLMSQAHFVDSRAALQDLDYAPDRKLDRRLITELSTGNYIHHARNVVIMGATGAGKSFLAQALGRQACRQGFTARYVTLSQLLDELLMAREAGIAQFQKVRKQYIKYRLLIIDEWLMFPIDEAATQMLMQLIDQRCHNNATMIVSQLEPAEWLDNIPIAIAAEAITDRLATRAHRITIQGDTSMRIRVPDSTGSYRET